MPTEPTPYPRGLDGLTAVERQGRLLCLLCYDKPQAGDITYSGHDITAGIVADGCDACGRRILGVVPNA